MKGLIKEFKEFISRGSVLDLAVGIIIGSAFTAIVDSLVNDLVMPLVSIFTGGINFDAWKIVIGAGENAPTFAIGSFIAALLNFIIVAIVIFIIVKAVNSAHKLSEKEAAPVEPTTKKCPYCFSEIPIKATKCSCCTSDLPAE